MESDRAVYLVTCTNELCGNKAITIPIITPKIEQHVFCGGELFQTGTAEDGSPTLEVVGMCGQNLEAVYSRELTPEEWIMYYGDAEREPADPQEEGGTS